MHIAVYGMESTSNPTIKNMLEVVTTIYKTSEAVINSCNDLKDFYSNCPRNLPHNKETNLTATLNENMDEFYNIIIKSNTTLKTINSFTEKLFNTIKTDLMRPCNTDQPSFCVLDNHIKNINTIRDIAILKIIDQAQLQPLTNKNDFEEISNIIIKYIQLVKTKASIHKNIVCAYSLKQFLPFIIDDAEYKHKSLLLTKKIAYIDTLIQKTVKTEYTMYDTINPTILFTKTLCAMNLDKRILKVYLLHVSENNISLCSSLQNHIKNINTIKEDRKTNMDIFNVMLNTQTDSLYNIISRIIELQKYLPVESIGTTKTEYYEKIIDILSHYIIMLKNSTIDTTFFDVECFKQLHNSCSRLKKLLVIDKTNQQINDIITVHTNKINEMLNVCVNDYKTSLEQDTPLDTIKSCLQVLFDTEDNNLEPYVTTVLEKIHISAPQDANQKDNSIIDTPIQETSSVTIPPATNTIKEIKSSQTNSPSCTPKETTSWTFANILALPWTAIKILFNYFIHLFTFK